MEPKTYKVKGKRQKNTRLREIVCTHAWVRYVSMHEMCAARIGHIVCVRRSVVDRSRSDLASINPRARRPAGSGTDSESQLAAKSAQSGST
jgi:hypothetical protein